MKFYLLYEHVFPFGFGLAALVSFAIAIYGFINRKPLVYTFTVTYVCILGIVVPLFLLAINHFLVAWPLEMPTTLLNLFGVLGSLILLCLLWVLGFEYTVIGAKPAQVKESARAVLSASAPPGADKAAAPESACRLFVWGIPQLKISYVRVLGGKSFNTREMMDKLRAELRERYPFASYLSYCFCLFVGVVCTTVASISWCVSTECIPYLF